MNAFIKTLVGDTRNVAGVAIIVAVAAASTALGHADWAVFAMPLAGLAVVVWLACH